MINETMALRNKGAGARIKEYTIDYPNKFKTIKAVEKFANNLKDLLMIYVKRRNGFFFFFFGVSEIDRKTAIIVKEREKGKGRRHSN